MDFTVPTLFLRLRPLMPAGRQLLPHHLAPRRELVIAAVFLRETLE